MDQLSWVVVAYLLTSTAVTPLWGKVGDLYGRRRVFQAAIVVFVAGSLLCGLAPTMLSLVLARGVQGLVDLVLLSLIGAGTGPVVLGALMVLVGLGMGMCMPVLSVATQNSLEPRDLGVGTSTLNFCRSLGGSLGVAGMGAVLAARLGTGLDDVAEGNPLPPGLDADNLANKPSSIGDLVDPLQGLVQSVLADAVAAAFLVVVPFAVLATVLTWRLRELPLRDVAGIGNRNAEEGAARAGTASAASAR